MVYRSLSMQVDKIWWASETCCTRKRGKDPSLCDCHQDLSLLPANHPSPILSQTMFDHTSTTLPIPAQPGWAVGTHGASSHLYHQTCSTSQQWVFCDVTLGLLAADCEIHPCKPTIGLGCLPKIQFRLNKHKALLGLLQVVQVENHR